MPGHDQSSVADSQGRLRWTQGWAAERRVNQSQKTSKALYTVNMLAGSCVATGTEDHFDSPKIDASDMTPSVVGTFRFLNVSWSISWF